jgi:hypothetical protein
MNNKLLKILKEIEEHNKKLYKSYKPTEKIDFSKSKKNWGTDVIPKEFWIDLSSHEYQLRCGFKIVNIDIVLYNSNNKEVTYPVKVSYIEEREEKKDKIVYDIFSLDGRKDINSLKEHPLDIVKVV